MTELTADELGQLFNFAFQKHDRKAIREAKRFRKSDGVTPYGIHPVVCAALLLHETLPVLTQQMKIVGAQALAYHDILEDTTADLPEHISDDVRVLVVGMTFPSSDEEMDMVWDRSPFIRMLKLYDKVSNLLDASWMTAQQLEKYQSYVRKLIDDVLVNYGELNIVKLARCLV